MILSSVRQPGRVYFTGGNPRSSILGVGLGDRD